MAVTAARITGVDDTVFGNERVHTRRLTFTSNYAAGGEAIAPSDFGLREFTRAPLLHGGVVMASALTTGVPAGFNSATNKIVMYELPATTTSSPPLAEKGAEAHLTGAFIDVTAFGR